MEAIMTDFQYKQIIKMVYKIMKNCENLEEAKKEILDLLGEKDEKSSD